MIFERFSARGRRERQARGLAAGPLRDYLETPIPEAGTPLSELRLLAVDVETTGLDPANDHLLSIGFVPVNGDRIDLNGAGHFIIRAGVEVGQSATFHRITDDRIATGVEPAVALEATLSALRGRVLLAHFDKMETGFLGSLCRELWGVRPAFTTVDTMMLEAGLLSGDRDIALAPGAVRLWAARARYGLPESRAHEALTDALSCAELYLAQIATCGATTLRDLHSLSR